jgi:coenzyme Q-binding protein COQ10
VRSVTPEGDSDVMLADLVVGFKMFRERFLSRVTMWEGTRRIDTEYIEGPFKHMNSTWVFRDLDEGGCEVAFDVDFEFKNKLCRARRGCSSTRRCNGSCAPSRRGRKRSTARTRGRPSGAAQ